MITTYFYPMPEALYDHMKARMHECGIEWRDDRGTVSRPGIQIEYAYSRGAEELRIMVTSPWTTAGPNADALMRQMIFQAAAAIAPQEQKPCPTK